MLSKSRRASVYDSSIDPSTSIVPDRKYKKLFDKLNGKGKYTHDYPTHPSTATPANNHPNPQLPKSKSEETPSTLTINLVPDPLLTKQSTKSDEMAEMY
jgi:hypothetical protein